MRLISSSDANGPGNVLLNQFLRSCRALVEQIPAILEDVVENIGNEDLPNITESAGAESRTQECKTIEFKTAGAGSRTYPFSVFLSSASVNSGGRLVLTVHNSNCVVDELEFPGFTPTRRIMRRNGEFLEGNDPALFDIMKRDIRLWFQEKYVELYFNKPAWCTGSIRWCADLRSFIWEQDGTERFLRLLGPQCSVQRHITLQTQASHLREMESLAEKVIRTLEQGGTDCDSPVATQEKWNLWIEEVQAIKGSLHKLRGEFAAH